MATVATEGQRRTSAAGAATVLGINVGHGYTKLYSFGAAGVQSYSMPSLIAEARQTRDDLVKVETVRIGQQAFWVGTDAARAAARPAFTQDRLYDPTYIPALVKAGLRRLGRPELELYDALVVTGLPATWATVREHAQAVAERLRAGAHPIPLGKVRVIAEPVGCVYAAMLTDSGEIVDDVYRRGSVAVVDLGHGTVDTAVVTQLVTDQASLTTYQLGTVRPLTQLQQWLSGRTEVDFALHQVEGAVRTGQIHLAGRDEPLPDGWERPFAENGRLIAAKLEQSWGKGRQFDAIVLGGGGAEIPLLVAAIRDRFPHAAVIAEPQLAIARGYARYGRYLLNQQGT